MKNVKFRGKTPIPRLGSKFRGPRQIVGPSDNILTLATSAQCRAEKPHYLSGNLPTSAARRGKPTTVPRADLPTSPRPPPTTTPPPSPRGPPRKPSHGAAGSPPYLRGAPRKTYHYAAGKPPYLRGAPRKTSLTSAARRGKPP